MRREVGRQGGEFDIYRRKGIIVQAGNERAARTGRDGSDVVVPKTVGNRVKSGALDRYRHAF